MRILLNEANHDVGSYPHQSTKPMKRNSANKRAKNNIMNSTVCGYKKGSEKSLKCLHFSAKVSMTQKPITLESQQNCDFVQVCTMRIFLATCIALE